MTSHCVLHTVAVADGCLAYRRWDPAEGANLEPALILLHGFTGSASSWADIAPALALRRTVYAFELPGHGLTELGSSEQPCDMTTFVRALDLAIDALEIAEFDLVGYSLGGRSALFFTLHATHPPRRLILESASPGIDDAAARAERVASDNALAEFAETEGIVAFTDRWEQTPLLASPIARPASTTESIRAGRLSCRTDGLAMSLRGMGTGTQAWLGDALSQLTLPVLCIVGSADEKFRAIANDMVTALPNGRAVIVADAGHSVHLDRPHEYARIIDDFTRTSGNDLEKRT
jgi:2-succinyl-6-hydroxy-2,4-cyclohexadiene-1-carboxylate synthase